MLAKLQSWLTGTATEDEVSEIGDEMKHLSEDQARLHKVVRVSSVLFNEQELLSKTH